MTRKESGFVERTMKSVHMACDAAGEDMVGTSLLIRDEVRSALTSLQSAAEAMREALDEYRSAFGQGCVAHGLPLGPQQFEADAKASAAICAFDRLKEK